MSASIFACSASFQTFQYASLITAGSHPIGTERAASADGETAARTAGINTSDVFLMMLITVYRPMRRTSFSGTPSVLKPCPPRW